MLSERIKTLFNFIDFLHSKIIDFKQYDDTMEELYLLDIKRSELKSNNNYKAKLELVIIQKELEEKFLIIDKNIIKLLRIKTEELNICDWKKTDTVYNFNISDIIELKDNFSKEDVEIILNKKQKYLEYKKNNSHNYFNSTFFRNLDEFFKELFSFFSEDDSKELNTAEEKSNYLDDIDKPKEKEINISANNEILHPKHDPNLWNSQCYKLFKYLFENYYDEGKKTARKLTNIWHFFKESEKSVYNLKCTQNEYKFFLKGKYGIAVGNFTKANKYDSEYSTIDDHRIIFESY